MYREIAAWLLPTALATDDGSTLVATVLEELRTRRIVCHRYRPLNGSVARFELVHGDSFGAGSPTD